VEKVHIGPGREIEERRKAQRLNLSIPVKFKFLSKQKILEETFCRDISGGGIKLRLNKPLDKGERLKTLLYFPDDPKPVSAISKVIWCKESQRTRRKETYFDMGLQHVRIVTKDKKRFVFLFCETMIDYFISDKARQ